MSKKAVKVATCCLASGLIMAAGSMVTNAADTSMDFPVAGVSFSFSSDNTALANNVAATQATEIVNNEVPTVTSEYANIAIAQVDNYVNIRDTASEDGEVLGKLYDNSAAEIVSTEGEWYQITSGSVTGYVKQEYVVVGDEELARSVGRRVAYVNTETLRVREGATADSGIVELVPQNEELTVTDESIDGWVGVSVGETAGYVSTEFVQMDTQFVQAESKEEEEARLAAEEAARKEAEAAAQAATAAAAQSAASRAQSAGSSSASAPASSYEDSYVAPTGSGSGSDVANYACQFIGNPYVYGGSSLTSGTDCSGFVMSVYAAYGVSLPHSSSALRSSGYEVSYDEAQPGDIICYSGHVAIYIGGGQIVHASTPATGICIGNATGSSILSVRRIF